MFKHTFDFGSDNLQIISSQKIKSTLLDKIFKFIQFVRYDFNPNIHGSSAYNFNNSKQEEIISVTHDFINFLKLFLDEVVDSNNLFFPFESSKEFDTHLDVLSLIDIKGDNVLKRVDIVADFNKLLKAFIIDFVFELIKSEGFSNIIVLFEDIVRVDEIAKWKAKFEIIEDTRITRDIQNAAISLSYNPLNLSRQGAKGFTGSPSKIFPLFVLLTAENAMKSKATGIAIGQMDNIYEIEKFIKKKQYDSLIIDGEMEKHYFWK